MDGKRQQLIALLREVDGIVAAQYRKCAGDPKLTMPQLIVLNLLALNGPMRISELAEQAYCSNSTVSGIVDRLERENLVCRTRSRQDRRVVTVALSAVVQEAVARNAQACALSLFAHAEEAELDRAMEGLQCLKTVLMRGVEAQEADAQ